MADDDGKVAKLRVVPKAPPAPLPQPGGQHCGICLHWMAETEGAPNGYCRRFPPAQMTVTPPDPKGDFRISWHFPMTTAEAWCGEWSDRAAFKDSANSDADGAQGAE